MIIKGRDVLNMGEVFSYFFNEFDDITAKDIDNQIEALIKENGLLSGLNHKIMVIMEKGFIKDKVVKEVIYCINAFEFNNPDNIIFDKTGIIEVREDNETAFCFYLKV